MLSLEESGMHMEHLVTSNPILSIWTRPRETVRNLLIADPTRYVLLWAVLAGIEQVLLRAATNRQPAPSLPIAITAVLVIGSSWGLLVLWLGSLLVRWTGGWMGGTASGQHLRTALSWACIPTVTALLLWIPRLLVFGPNILLGSTRDQGDAPGPLLFSLALAYVNLILGVWGTVLACNTVAEVQGFRSAWQGLANLIVAGLIVFAAVLPFIVWMIILLAEHRGG